MIFSSGANSDSQDTLVTIVASEYREILIEGFRSDLKNGKDFKSNSGRRSFL